MIPGLAELQQQTLGDRRVCVAVLDGPVDLSHPCFAGADLRQLSTMVQGEATRTGRMSAHGTHVASVIFGQPGSPVQGLAPHCRGLVVPIFSDNDQVLSQLDLARAINLAVEAGAHVINISGGEVSSSGEADRILEQAVKSCAEQNVLIVAAGGNDACECLHVPAALPAVLAIGAMDENRSPLRSSNWGKVYQKQGLLAPGYNVTGAEPGGGTVQRSGTSFATPIAAGVAALMLSRQLSNGGKPDPNAVRRELLASAEPCKRPKSQNDKICLVGTLSIPRAVRNFTKGNDMSENLQSETSAITHQPPVNQSAGVTASACGCQSAKPQQEDEEERTGQEFGGQPPVAVAAGNAENPVAISPSDHVVPSAAAAVNPSADDSSETRSAETGRREHPGIGQHAEQAQPGGGLVYALGTLGYDFGNEARRDAFKQLMPPVDAGGMHVPANPHDARQMVDHLNEHPSEAIELIWTMNLELTPVYAFQASGPFAREVYEMFQQLLAGEVNPEDSEDYVERVSIPGRLTGRKVQLFSGQQVPLVEVISTRGIYGWKVNTLIERALEAVRSEASEVDEAAVRSSLSSFLNRVYYDLRNLGQTPQERATNFAATNAFQVAAAFSDAVAGGLELDTIVVTKSPFCRMDSDCWDVVLRFFNPLNLMHASKEFRFTIDVSDVIPVTLGEIRSWSRR